MFSRRFLLLAGVLVSLNVALWFAAPGLALRNAVVQQVFGPKVVRLEVIEKGGADWRIDRGVITSVNSTQLTLREADGRIQAIPLSTSTVAFRLGRRISLGRLTRHWDVLATWRANGAAQSVDVERVPQWLRKTIVRQFFGPRMIRAEAINKAPLCGSTDCRVDRGVITSVSSSQLTLREADGRVQQIPLSTSTQVIYLGGRLSVSSLAHRWHVLVTWPASGAAESVDVERIPHAPNGHGAGANRAASAPILGS